MMIKSNRAAPRLRRRPDDASSSTEYLFKGVVFVVAFWMGHYSVSTVTTSTHSIITAPTSGMHSDDGWNSIHVFYGAPPSTNSHDTMNTSTKHWHSQVGQDELVVNLLNYKRGAYFVDLAANDAVEWSNTYALEQYYDWTGLCIEPTPRYWNDLVVMRNCRAVGAVLGNATSAKVHWKRGGAYSGIVGFDNPDKGRQYPIKYTVSLQSVFERFHAPHRVDYLSLDVEGAEEYILQDLSDLYIFSIMTIERPSRSVMMLLQTRGYKYLATLSEFGETIWAHESTVLNSNQTLLEHYRETYAEWNPETMKQQQQG